MKRFTRRSLLVHGFPAETLRVSAVRVHGATREHSNGLSARRGSAQGFTSAEIQIKCVLRHINELIERDTSKSLGARCLFNPGRE